jgi:hypothetical protein
LLAIILLAAAVTLGYLGFMTRTASLSDEEWDICEAVLHHQIAHSFDRAQTAGTAYVEIRGENPIAVFLDRFPGRQPPVRAACWRFSDDSGVLYTIDEICTFRENLWLSHQLEQAAKQVAEFRR